MIEKNIMKEILARGPVTVGILANIELQLYESGIITCEDILMPTSSYTESQIDSLRRIRDRFRFDGHTVTIIGWGVDKDGVKYWIIQNSY